MWALERNLLAVNLTKPGFQKLRRTSVKKLATPLSWQISVPKYQPMEVKLSEDLKALTQMGSSWRWYRTSVKCVILSLFFSVNGTLLLVLLDVRNQCHHLRGLFRVQKSLQNVFWRCLCWIWNSFENKLFYEKIWDFNSSNWTDDTMSRKNTLSVFGLALQLCPDIE